MTYREVLNQIPDKDIREKALLYNEPESGYGGKGNSEIKNPNKIPEANLFSAFLFDKTPERLGLLE